MVYEIHIQRNGGKFIGSLVRVDPGCDVELLYISDLHESEDAAEGECYDFLATTVAGLCVA